jgi:hypothetical protein
MMIFLDFKIDSITSYDIIRNYIRNSFKKVNMIYLYKDKFVLFCSISLKNNSILECLNKIKGFSKEYQLTKIYLQN